MDSCYGPARHSPLVDGSAGKADGAHGHVRMPQADTVPRPYFVDRDGNAPPFRPSHELLRILAAIPPTASSVFTPQQLAALDVAIARTRPRPGSHKLDYRVSVPFFGRRYYFVLLGGKDRRTRARVIHEGHAATWRLSLAYVILMSAVMSGGMFAVVLVLYVVKSLLGINVFEEHSILHNLFF